MTRTPSSKEDALARHGTVNPHPEAVTDPRFLREEFFDPRDLVQVRYEMVRRVEVEGMDMVSAAPPLPSLQGRPGPVPVGRVG